jgi:hypothetical protein
MSAVRTERLGSFLNVDFEPRVAASLGQKTLSLRIPMDGIVMGNYQSRPKPLSLLVNSSGVKNITPGDVTALVSAKSLRRHDLGTYHLLTASRGSFHKQRFVPQAEEP